MELESHINFGSNSKREIEPDFFFMMNCLLYSRMETGYPSNHDFYDEDVNVYLANLLCSFMNPEYHRRAKKYLSPYDQSLFEKIKDSSDVRLKYTIYKTNADFLLISIGIFRNPDGRGVSSPLFKHTEEAHMGKGKAYYQFAYSYSQSMFRKPTAISEVLEKLSRGFENYVEILSHMRGEYFNILERLGNGDIYHLERSIDKYQESEELKELRDRFLDLYSAYRKSKDPELRIELEKLVKAIQLIDESFYFKIDD
ncbi:MAG: hypothetical protein GTO51_10515 [Candidatus Latescibacteria bacterium]|nr:hypothetical protein [Candidatus Latescibacterota bacterium]NIM66401.1 hypothetical protein [Candidatus Latescibacterota bacterium]NIO02880.1 hypothetical protein [Candidatus Latescibacterota bacterium]NIO30015.1 hypothetical protein [Candidatus Latescibacterota bacterium]NIO57630.1 hypothetical protein [Candidatus Latescibacterota bacterium]